MVAFLEHPIPAFVFAVIAFGVGVSGKLSSRLSIGALATATVLGFYGVYEAADYSLRVRIPFLLAFAGAMAALMWWVWRKPEANKPRLMLTAQHGKPFRLVHLGGDAAQHIQVEPIQSALGKNIWVRFEAVDFLSAAKAEARPSFCLYLHGFPKPNNDMGLLGAALFSGDAIGHQTVDYVITISFHWAGKRLSERQTLTWHYATKTLTSGNAK
jgi:hypothetical protein